MINLVSRSLINNYFEQPRKQNANQGKPPGLAGCADRMRNVVMQELDMVVGVKEASQSREHVSCTINDLWQFTLQACFHLAYLFLVDWGPQNIDKASEWPQK